MYTTSARATRRCTSVTKSAHCLSAPIPNNFHAISPAISLLIKIRCASVLTKAHHRTSLTEGQDARPPDQQSPALRADSARGGVRAPVAVSPFRRFPDSPARPSPCAKFPNEPTAMCQLRPASHPRAPRRTIPAKCAERTHVPSCPTRQNPPRIPGRKTNPPIPIPASKTTISPARRQNKPTKACPHSPLHVSCFHVFTFPEPPYHCASSNGLLGPLILGLGSMLIIVLTKCASAPPAPIRTFRGEPLSSFQADARGSFLSWRFL